jgi:ATP-binding cassette subfamily B (MDR/TAP) protein 1
MNERYLLKILKPLSAILMARLKVVEMMDIIHRKPIIDSMSLNGDKLFGDISGVVEFKDVMFSYPTRSDAAAIIDFNLTVESGEFVALVGPSGSGKSTIISLLLRLYDPCRGNIFFSGRDVKELNVRWLRTKIGY